MNSPLLGLGLAVFLFASWVTCVRCFPRERHKAPRLPYYNGGFGDRDARVGFGDKDARDYGDDIHDGRGGSPSPPYSPTSNGLIPPEHTWEGGVGSPHHHPLPDGVRSHPATPRDGYDTWQPPTATGILEWLGLWTHGGSDSLRDSLRDLGSARQLWLTEIDDESAFHIADALTPGHARKLEVMRIGKHVGADGCAALADALGRGGAPILQALHLSGNPLGDDGAAALAYDLLRAGGCPRLRDLQLNHCQIGDAGAEALAEALRDGFAPLLQNVWLGGNVIGDYGADLLANAVTPGVGQALGLRRLALYSNSIAEAGALSLGRALEARGRERHGSGGQGISVLTVMLFGNQLADEATVRHLADLDGYGERENSDRVELWAPPSMGGSSPYTSQYASAAASPTRLPPQQQWGSPPAPVRGRLFDLM